MSFKRVLVSETDPGFFKQSQNGEIAKQFLDPYDNENYGRGEDPLCVDTLIAETNAGSLRWMYGFDQFPVSSQRIKDGELFDYSLPVRGYSVEELEKMEEERLQKERELRELREREEAQRLEAERVEELEAMEQENETDALVEATVEAKEFTEHVSESDGELRADDLIGLDATLVISNRSAGNATQVKMDGEQASNTSELVIAETFEQIFPGEVLKQTNGSSTLSAQSEETNVNKVTHTEGGLPVSLLESKGNETDSLVASVNEEVIATEALELQGADDTASSAGSNHIMETNVTAVDQSSSTDSLEEIRVEEVIGNASQDEETLIVEKTRSTPSNMSADEEQDADFFLLENEAAFFVPEMADFEAFRDLPWFDEVGSDGQELRLSQQLADEEWQEEKAYEIEKASLSSPLTLEDFEKRKAELIEAAENELLETELVMMASPGGEGRSIDSSDKSSQLPSYDQTKLDGISQLWGLPPDDIDGFTGPSPPVDVPYEEDGFDNISQLWGRTPEPQSASEEATLVGAESFDSIAQLWDEDEGLGEAVFGMTEPNSNLEALDSTDHDHPASSDDDDIDYSLYEGFEWYEDHQGDRLSQSLADEVWDYPDGDPAEQIKTLEDYTKKVVEILEAAEDEILETEAILRAPPAAESVKIVEREDDDEKALLQVNDTRPVELSEESDSDAGAKENDLNLDALGMDVDPPEDLLVNATHANAADDVVLEKGTINRTKLAAETNSLQQDTSDKKIFLLTDEPNEAS